MQVVADYFEPDKAAVAAEALGRAEIPFEQATRTEDGIESVEFSVAEEHVERAAWIIEKLEEIFARADSRQPATCPHCGSSELARHQKTGAFGQYEVFLCRSCRNVAVRRA